jgi:hypothetical protein
MEGAFSSVRVPSKDLSLEAPIPFEPAHRESTKPRSVCFVLFFQDSPTLTRHRRRKQAPVGWTYRQILETVALPPPEGLHLWPTKVTQLAVDLGMPNWYTGRDIVAFVLHVASVKNELQKVVPLVKALAAAARVLEGRIVAPTTLLPVVLAVYPNNVPPSTIEPVGADSKTARKRCHDEVRLPVLLLAVFIHSTLMLLPDV